jgi:hypothetical protein
MVTRADGAGSGRGGAILANSRILTVGHLRAYVVTPTFEPALEAELSPSGAPTSSPVAGVVTCGDADPRGAAGADLEPVFARQVLPDAREVRGTSVAQLAEAAYRALEAHIDGTPGPFTVHAFAKPEALAGDDVEPAAATATAAVAVASDAGLGSRAGLIGRTLLELLKQRRRRAFRRYRPPVEAEASFGPSWLLVQLLALERDRLLISAAHPRPLPLGGTDLAPWPAGDAPVAIDRTPPSRAYQKLEEAFCWMSAAPGPGTRCVDLGGSPGGWAYTALRRGARVTAVDRAPLLPPAAGHANLSAIVGNAFTFEPPQPVDWLLCDVICEPARSIALIDRWIERRWCENLVVTVKFKGRDGYGILSGLLPMFARAGWRFARVKHLAHNKNEVTVMARHSGRTEPSGYLCNVPGGGTST